MNGNNILTITNTHNGISIFVRKYYYNEYIYSSKTHENMFYQVSRY